MSMREHGYGWFELLAGVLVFVPGTAMLSSKDCSRAGAFLPQSFGLPLSQADQSPSTVSLIGTRVFRKLLFVGWKSSSSTMVGVRKMMRLDFVRVLDSLRNRYPRPGISPSRGTLVSCSWTLSWIKPPMTRVLPLGIMTVVLTVRVSKEGTLLLTPPTMLFTRSPRRTTVGLLFSLGTR